MDYNFDIYEIFATLDSLQPELASLSCREIDDTYIATADNILSCMYVNRQGINKANTPFELLYIMYGVIYKNIITNISESVIEYNNIAENQQLQLAANYEPTCPQTITEVDAYKSDVDDIFEKITAFLESLASNKYITKVNQEKALFTSYTVKSAIQSSLHELMTCIENNKVYMHLPFIGNSTKYIEVFKDERQYNVDMTTIMKPGIILAEIDSFIEYLSTLYMFQVNVVVMRDKVSSEIKGTLHRPANSACGYAPKGYKFLLAVQQQEVKSSNASSLYQNDKSVLYANSIISFDGISRFSTFPSSSQKMLVENGINTNGSYDSTISISTTELFDKDDIKQKYRDTANLEVGKIASRNDILHAIYDIFYYWLNNVNVVNINVNICHSNCHTNYYEIKKYRNTSAGNIASAGVISARNSFGTY